MDTTPNMPAPAEGQAPRGPLNSDAEAAKAFLGLLSGKPGKQETKKSQTAEQAPAVTESEAEEVDASDETPDDEADHLSSGAEEDGEDADNLSDAEDADEAPAEQTVTVKIDGKEVDVPLSEVRDGYMRQKDYSRKTAEVAAERQQLHAEFGQVQQERAQYAQILPILAQQIAAALPQPPSEDLRRTDPVEYLLQQREYDAGQERLVAAQSEFQRVNQLQAMENAKVIQQAVVAGFKKLPDMVPEWRDPKVFARDQQAMREYAKSKLGYSDEELDQAYDARMIVALQKAMKYDRIASKKPVQAQDIEKVVRTAQSTADVPKPRREYRESRQRLRESGSVDDAAKAIRSLLG